MKIAVIAVAGVSSRFNENVNEPVLKGIYTTSDYKKTLLYSILKKCNGYDKVILVGGYQYDNLQQYVYSCRDDFSFEIQLVYNPYYQEYGTGYTLKVGLEQCLQGECSEITLIEGDLFFDKLSFERVKRSKKNVVTYSEKAIHSNKAVIAYVNQNKKIKYVFSSNHDAVQIQEPFWEIYNSGQIWKFTNIDRVKKILKESSDSMWIGTNLKFVEEYFEEIAESEREILCIDIWENCNTKDDYLNNVEQL